MGSRHASCTGTGVDSVTEPFTDHVDAEVAASALKPKLAAALAVLPKSQRDALLLLVWADLSYEQIAVATGAPLGTVQSRISLARRGSGTDRSDGSGRGDCGPRSPVASR